MSTDSHLSHHDDDSHRSAADNAPDALDYAEDHDVQNIHQAVLREKEDPEDGMEPVPLWLIGACMLIVGYCFWYLGAHSGGFSKEEYSGLAYGGRYGWSYDGSVATTTEDGGPTKVDPIAAGKRHYSTYCASCHMANGMGVKGQNPYLVNSPYVIGSEKRLAAILLHGIKGPIYLTETPSNWSGNMQAWSSLGPKRISQILTFIRQEWGNEAGPISEELVKEVQDLTKDRKEQWTHDELMAAFPDEG